MPRIRPEIINRRRWPLRSIVGVDAAGWRWVGAITIATGLVGCEVPPRTVPAPAAARSNADAMQEDDLRLFATMLNDDAVPFAFRREAAMRLAESGGRDAAEAFRIAFRDGDESQRDMVVEAIRASGSTGRPVVRTLLDAMLAEKVDSDDVAQIMVADSGRDLDLVRERFFQSAGTDDWERYADLLARIPLPEAAEILIDAMGEVDDESSSVVVDAALRRWSNTTETRDANGWRQWWVRLSLGEDGTSALQQLTDRIAVESSRADRALARAVAAETRAQQLATRLAEVKTRAMALLEGESRTDALRAMFVDEEPLVRAAGISQVERMLRNAQPIPDVVRRDLSTLITDDMPANRISTVKILDAIGVDGLADTLASSLMSEPDPTVVAAGLAVLGNRPNPVAIPLAVETLQRADPTLTSAAARVIGEVAAAGLLHPDDRIVIRELLPELDQLTDRDTARTKVLIADEDGLEAARGLLRSDTEAVRRGAAEGFRKRGLRDVLREEASDPTVRRVAIQTWIDSPPAIDLVNLEVLQELRPLGDTEQARSDLSTWLGAVVQILEALPIDRLADAERMLQGEASLLDARCASLRRGLSGGLLTMETRQELQGLLLDAMAEGERWTELVAELRSLDAESPDSPYRARLFELLVRTQDWDGAAILEPSVSAWIELAEDERVEDPRILGPLLGEIERRFDAELGPRERERLELIAPSEGSSDG